MQKVIIYRENKSPTQSGNSKTKFWYLKFENNNVYEEDLMTGWKGGIAPIKKIKIKFSSLERAVEYAKKKNYDYQVLNFDKRGLKLKSYADNFRFNRNKSDLE